MIQFFKMDAVIIRDYSTGALRGDPGNTTVKGFRYDFVKIRSNQLVSNTILCNDLTCDLFIRVTIFPISFSYDLIKKRNRKNHCSEFKPRKIYPKVKDDPKL